MQSSEVNKPITDRFMVRGGFDLPEPTADTRVSLFTAIISDNQAVYVNGKRVAVNIKCGAAGQDYALDNKLLRKGRNVFAAIGTPFLCQNLAVGRVEYLSRGSTGISAACRLAAPGLQRPRISDRAVRNTTGQAGAAC